MQQQVVAFDFDDVLMHFNVGFIAFHNRIYGTNIKYNEVFSYDMELVYGCDAEVILERVKAFYQSSDHAEVEPIPGAVEAVRCLRDRHLLDIVTSRPDTFRECTHTWIERFFPGIFRALHFTNGFGAANGVRKRLKSEICKEIGAIVLVDDALKHAEEVAKKGIPVLLPDRPWNRDYTPRGVIRVKSWDEIISWIETHV